MERLKQHYASELAVFQQQKQTIRRLWNIDDKSASLLYMLVRIKNPKRMVEIGTSNGFSGFWNALACARCGTEFHTIEVDETRFHLAKKNLQQRKNIIFHFGLAEDIIPNLPGPIDFVFIDAGKIGYIEYLKRLLPKLSDQAVLIADNVISHAHTVNAYLDFVSTDNRFETMTLNVDAGFEISIFSKEK